MPEVHSQGYCHACQRKVTVRAPGCRHFLHLVLSLLTLGLWIIVWGVAAIGKPKWFYDFCGTFVGRYKL